MLLYVSFSILHGDDDDDSFVYMSMYRLVALLISINWLSSLPPLLIRLLVKPFKRKLLLLLVNWVLGKC